MVIEALEPLHILHGSSLFSRYLQSILLHRVTPSHLMLLLPCAVQLRHIELKDGGQGLEGFQSGLLTLLDPLNGANAQAGKGGQLLL